MYNKGGFMSVLDMAKAHLQNVHAKIEDLKLQKNRLEDEIQQLTLYISNGLKAVEDAEKESGTSVN
jgi:hypothetical protein